MTQNLNLQVCGADLFLLVYTQRATDRGLRSLTDLPEADQNLLRRLRKPEELQDVHSIWLRTCYEDGSDAAFSAFMREQGPHESELPVFEDAHRYNYGGGHSWRHIFTLLPQLLDPPNKSPEKYEAMNQEALEECFENEQQDIEEVRKQGGIQEEDGTYWGELYSLWHYTTQVGMIFVIDEKTLRVAADDPRSAKVLAVWFDEMGRVVRYRRMNEYSTNEVEVRMGPELMESGMWIAAKPGDDYKWEGPLGPPALIGEEYES